MQKICNESHCLNLIRNLVCQNIGKTLILIAGATCSGKTYLSRSLAQIFPASAAICGDLYFRDITDPLLPKNTSGGFLFDVPGAYRDERLKIDAQNSLQGHDIFSPDYNIRDNHIVSDYGKKIKSGNPLIIECLFAIKFLSGVHNNTIRIYMDTDKEVCMARRMARDSKVYNISEHRVREVFLAKFWPSYQHYGAEQKNIADIIIKQT